LDFIFVNGCVCAVAKRVVRCALTEHFHLYHKARQRIEPWRNTLLTSPLRMFFPLRGAVMHQSAVHFAAPLASDIRDSPTEMNAAGQS